MRLESIIILLGSIGFVLMGFFALYTSTRENKVTKEQKEYIKINGIINLITGFIGTSISLISIISKSLNKIAIVIFIATIFIGTLIQLLLSKKYKK